MTPNKMNADIPVLLGAIDGFGVVWSTGDRRSALDTAAAKSGFQAALIKVLTKCTAA